MKLYQLLLLVLFGQIFITLPIQKNYINVDDYVPENIVYSVLSARDKPLYRTNLTTAAFTHKYKSSPSKSRQF
ncbi:hypothetical protein D4S03_11815 [bacterium]|nr:MAG: hypothetical protein D4S03_11815 [bacterium]